MSVPRSAEKVINFIERYCTLTKDQWAGRPFLLHPFQKNDIIVPIFGPTLPDGRRRIRTAYMEIASKNGKTEICAALGLYGTVADDTAGAEVYICGKARRQAEKMFDVAAAMVRNNPDLHHALRVLKTTKTIVHRYDPLSFLRAVSADAGVEDGANPHFVLFDELHRQRTRNLYDVMKRKQSTRFNPLFLSLTTAGTEAESALCWEMHEYARKVKEGVWKDPSFCPVLFTCPNDADWTDERNWYLANPAMEGPNAFKDIEAVRADFRVAKRVPSQENSFRRFELSQWVSATERWVPLHEWDAKPMGEPFNLADLEGRDAFCGLDLSTNRDLTAFVMLIPKGDQVFVAPHYFIPEHGLAERAERDGVPYDAWKADEANRLHVTPGRNTDYAFVRKLINEKARLFNIRAIAYDPWGAPQLAGELEQDGFTMIKFVQSIKNYTPPCRAFERMTLARLFRHAKHPILRWNVDCTNVRVNAFEELAPVKPDRKVQSSRIDGVTALLMGLDVLIRNIEEDLTGFLSDPIVVSS